MWGRACLRGLSRGEAGDLKQGAGDKGWQQSKRVNGCGGQQTIIARWYPKPLASRNSSPNFSPTASGRGWLLLEGRARRRRQYWAYIGGGITRDYGNAKVFRQITPKDQGMAPSRTERGNVSLLKKGRRLGEMDSDPRRSEVSQPALFSFSLFPTSD